MVKHRETSVWVEVDGHVLPEVHMKGFVSRLDGTYRVSGFIPSQAGKSFVVRYRNMTGLPSPADKVVDVVLDGVYSDGAIVDQGGLDEVRIDRVPQGRSHSRKFMFAEWEPSVSVDGAGASGAELGTSRKQQGCIKVCLWEADVQRTEKCEMYPVHLPPMEKREISSVFGSHGVKFGEPFREPILHSTPIQVERRKKLLVVEFWYRPVEFFKTNRMFLLHPFHSRFIETARVNEEKEKQRVAQAEIAALEVNIRVLQEELKKRKRFQFESQPPAQVNMWEGMDNDRSIVHIVKERVVSGRIAIEREIRQRIIPLGTTDRYFCQPTPL